uniref:U6 snRNA-associated Sm-like protein LSm7 n=1 Tax=Paramormyrops kingsleyae TaxID=1676925 RepID=A0A3B3SID2_9TELE
MFSQSRDELPIGIIAKLPGDCTWTSSQGVKSMREGCNFQVCFFPSPDKEKKKKESIFDLSKYIDKTIRVKFQGGREASGVLKGFDPLLNLVLDGTIEYMRDPDDQYKLTEDTRQLGLVVCRGTSVVLICPQDGMEAIPNPFIQQQDG